MGEGAAGAIFAVIEPMLDDVERLYKHVHRHPELSMQEERTAALRRIACKPPASR
jgi:metal-dependent amidase/aminoacylase/carboxypeptidase family protein